MKATLHWVSAPHAVDLEARLYDHLFLKEDPTDVEGDGTWLDGLNPNSLVVCRGKGEPSLQDARPLDRFQFERKGYFCVDADSSKTHLVFNRTVGLRDTWAKTHGAEG